MRKKSRYTLWIVLAIAVPIIGYGIAHGMTLLFPPSEQSTFSRLIFVSAMIIGLLVVPYWMLKLTMRAAHERNSAEKEGMLKDIPKDQEQATRS